MFITVLFIQDTMCIITAFGLALLECPCCVKIKIYNNPSIIFSKILFDNLLLYNHVNSLFNSKNTNVLAIKKLVSKMR